MYCSKCGKKNKDEAVFCYACGSRIVSAQALQDHLGTRHSNKESQKCELGQIKILALCLFLLCGIILVFKIVADNPVYMKPVDEFCAAMTSGNYHDVELQIAPHAVGNLNSWYNLSYRTQNGSGTWRFSCRDQHRLDQRELGNFIDTYFMDDYNISQPSAAYRLEGTLAVTNHNPTKLMEATFYTAKIQGVWYIIWIEMFDLLK